ncbi:MAG: sporulation protein YqfD [Lachnospiraceae bacterium]|nr:sporulation protein YqfD [Lachnospiraceae bacterium]
MLTSLLRLGRGYVRIRLTGYSPERFLNLCRSREILIWDLQNNGIAYEMCLSVRDFRRLKPLLRKTHSRMILLERHGLPFFLYRYRKRKMFFAGIVLAGCILYGLSFFIWNIHIEGNISLSTEVVLEYLESEQVVHGMWKKDVDCEAIRTGLRIRYPDIVWVSAEIRGTRLIIRMKENRDSFQPDTQEEEGPRDIVAAKDGTLTSILVRSGVPKAQAGEAVEEGQLLISGTLDILDDAGTVLRNQYVPSDGTIYAETTYPYEDYFLLSHEEQVYTGRKRRTFYLEAGEQRLTLCNPFQNFSNSSTIKKEYPLHLTENFYLPLIFGTTVNEEYEILVRSYTKEEAESLAKAHLKEFIEKLREKGVQIIKNDVKISTTDYYCQARGTIYVIEEIGRPVPLVPKEEPLMLPEEQKDTGS